MRIITVLSFTFLILFSSLALATLYSEASQTQSSTLLGARNASDNVSWEIGQYNQSSYYVTDTNTGLTTVSSSFSTVMSNATSGVVQIQNGTYIVNASITLNNDTSLEGFGNDTVLKLGDGVNSEILQIANNSHDISVSNMELDGNRANQNTDTWLIDGTGTSQRITLTGLNIHDSYRTGILLGASQNSTIENCVIHDVGRSNGTAGDAANCFGGAGIMFRGNICYSYVDSGFAFQGSSATIVNNTFENGWVGVYFGTGLGSNDSICFANKFLSNTVASVILENPSVNDVVSGNIIEGSSVGVSIQGAQNCTVAGNSITGSTSTNMGSIQFLAPASSVMEVSGNTISNGAWDGIRFFNGSVSEAVSVWNNTVTGCRYGINTDPLENGSVTGITILGNYLYQNRRSGIDIIRALNCTVDGNTCFDNSQGSAGTYDGITLWGDAASPSNFNSVTNNTCYDDQLAKTQNYGVREFGVADYNVIEENDLRGNIRNYVAIAGLHTVVENNIFDSVSILPVSANLDVGQSQLFAATVSGETSLVTYTWYLNNTVVSIVTDPSWNFTPSSPGSYTVYVNTTDNFGVALQSNFASVTVNPALSVTVSPPSANLDIGQSQLFNSTVSSGTSPYAYQWYLNDSAVSDATSPNWTFTPSSPSSCDVYVSVTDNVNSTENSSSAIVTVNLAPSVNISPLSVNLDVSQSQLFNSSVSGGDGPFSYQWYLNGATIPGATSETWNFTSSSSGSFNIYVNVTDNIGSQAESSIALVTVNPMPSVSISPISVTLDVGQSQNCTATVSNGTSPYSYQWYCNGTAVSGVTSESWTFTPTLPGSYMVYVEAIDSVGVQAMSNTVDVNVSTVVELSVSSGHGNPKPANGDSFCTFDSLVTCNVTSPVTESGTGWRCTGWTGTGSVPPVGNFSSVTFMITEDSSIMWNWQILPALVNSLAASPNPFSPNGDGIKDTSTITATFNVAVNWNLQVRSSSGTAVRTWTGTGTRVSVVWDGKNSSGFRVTDGTYTVRLSGADMSGVAFTTASVTLTVDAKRPTVTSVSVSSTSFSPRSGQTTKITYTLSESCYVTIAVYNSAGTLVRTLVNNVLQSSGAQSLTWNGKTSSSTVVPAGTYTIRIYVTDKAGNKAIPYPTTKTVKVT